jgi:hypothetical protein
MPDSQRIDIPGVGIVEFPSTMSDADIAAAAKRLHDEAAASSAAAPGPGTMSRFGSSLLDELPIPSANTVSRAVSDPGGLAKDLGNGLVDTLTKPFVESGRAVQSLGRAAALPFQNRAGKAGEAQSDLSDAALHAIAAVPFFGSSLIKQGEQTVAGDRAGAAGTLTGAALNALAMFSGMAKPGETAPPSDLDLIKAEVKAGRLPQQILDLAQQKAERAANPPAPRPAAAPMAPTRVSAPVDIAAPAGAQAAPRVPAGASADAKATSAPIEPGRNVQSVAELAQSLRRLYGSRDAGAMLNPADPKAGQAMIERLAPGPSRTPYAAETAAMDSRFRQLIDDPRGVTNTDLLASISKRAPGYLAAKLLAQHFGIPYTDALLATGGVDYMLTQHPQATANIARGAAGANLATRTDQGQTRRELYDLLRQYGLTP